MTPVILMEDHSQAYFAWKRAGIREAWCWHVDAHLDIGTDGLGPDRLARLQACDDSHQAAGLCGNPYLPWGGLHCGNYLYPAIREGLISRLTWVIPPGLVQGRLLPWARAHVNGWLDLSVVEVAGWVEEQGYIRGTLLGIPFWLGLEEALPRPDRPVLLDIDLDYFITESGQVWKEPDGCFADLQSCFTSVAFSVRGGYTPGALRRLARPWSEEFAGDMGSALDEAAALVRRGDYAAAVPACSALLSAHTVEASYLLGTSLHHLDRSAEAWQAWSRILEVPELPPDGRAYLLGLGCEALCRLDQPEQALECARRAMAEVEPDYRLFWAAAMAYEKLGDLRQATKMVRRGLQLAEPYLFGLQMRLVLSRLYRQQGKQGLASLELERLEKADLLGQLRPLTLLR